MTDIVLSLIPIYGVYLIFCVVTLACLGLPLPSSVLVLTAAGLSASEDTVIWQVFLVTFLAYVIGDQIAFNGARLIGPSLIEKMKKGKRLAALVGKGETFLNKHGLFAVFLSRTLFSPLGPTIGYLSGAVGMKWLTFSFVAAAGALTWAFVYCLLGYLFAGQLTQLSDLVASILIVGVASVCAIGFAIWIIVAWRRFDYSEI